MIHANGFQQALQALNVPTPVLKSYYHNIIDRQFWLKKYRRRLQRLSPKQYRTLNTVYFHSAIMAELSAIEPTSFPIRSQLLTLTATLFALINRHISDPRLIFRRLPKLSPTPRFVLIPRIRPKKVRRSQPLSSQRTHCSRITPTR
jgi:hypothetical protein